ncbi:GNAT family N-acetyltransferase [Rhodococcus jostii]|uniref:GNAT family N-acetyltransferase n=1 Tax=Rhodococcus jostii TaxID=132919 RepID=A0ABU4CTK1_RHOJO|nr:GNAT family N-acetyltransferase [Rhodococcus jostii]MDV6286896.1 GNAT family N-acetyltransferase [Rhodococcus jostii]
MLAKPELAHYVIDWPRAGDLGVIAEDESPVGAAWLRFLPESDPGYGFVDSATPELTIGVLQGWRGQGVGARLLETLIDSAREKQVEAVILSVEPDNYALGLYERFGFEQVGTVGGAITMLLQL